MSGGSLLPGTAPFVSARSRQRGCKDSAACWLQNTDVGNDFLSFASEHVPIPEHPPWTSKDLRRTHVSPGETLSISAVLVGTVSDEMLPSAQAPLVSSPCLPVLTWSQQSREGGLPTAPSACEERCRGRPSLGTGSSSWLHTAGA